MAELFRPIPESRRGPYACRVIITAKTRTYERTVLGEDSVQSLMLALRAVDQKLHAIADKAKGRMTWLGADIPPIFSELAHLDRLSGSLTHLMEALQLARDALADPTLTAAERRRAARKVAPVLESCGIVDVAGVHLKRKTPEHFGRWWTESRTPVRRRGR